MKGTRGAVGAWGEALAARYLERAGYFIVDRNARTPYGELDLVARTGPEPGTVVFVEVKTRTTRSYGLPEESVTSRKQQHLLASAYAYLQAHPELGDDWRIDVIAILRLRSNAEPSIQHFENAIHG